MDERGARPVVVGIDEDDGGRGAGTLAVALREAALRGVRLEVVHASRLPEHAGTDGGRVGAVVERLRELAPGVTLVAVAATGEPYEILLAATERAQLLVVGGRRLEATVIGRGLVPRLVDHASCPVLVVHDGGQLHIPQVHDLPVIAGVDGTADSEAVLAYAFDEAAARHAPLVAIHVARRAVYQAGEADRAAAAMLAEHVAAWSQRYPGVRVDRIVLHANPGDALVEQSARAQLVVVGVPRRAHLGSVVHPVVRHAHCPVVVLRPASAGALAGAG